eukprot:3748421-Pleurochrysis_carterae.AAC.2
MDKVRNAETDERTTSFTHAAKQSAWMEVMKGLMRYGAENKAHFSFAVAFRPTCAEYARVSYGIAQHTWNGNLALLRRGHGHLQAKQTSLEWKAAVRSS